MASRLVPLLAVAACIACAGVGCGAAGAAGSSAAGSRAAGSSGSRSHASGTPGSRTTTAASARHPFVESVRKPRARIWAIGDSAGGPHAAEVEHLIAGAHPDRLLYLGDIYPVGNADGFRAYARVYGALRTRTAPTPGNHDWPFRSSGYDAYWHHPPQWYSFKAAGWRIISLNSETDQRTDQLRHLEALLRAHGNCRIAFWHRPRYSGGLHGDAADMAPFWRALQGHATLVVSGHDHDMQRFAPRGGLIQMVAGAGGESHYAVNRTHPGLRFADDTHWGALRIDLSRGHAKTAFVASDGRTLDSHRLTCDP